MRPTHFADRLLETCERKRSQVVVGLDPRLELMPSRIVEGAVERHGRTARAAAQAIVEFNRGILEAVEGAAVAVKCQIAFYERFGTEGIKAYARTIADARRMGLMVIGDVKRNDIGSTARAYADAHLRHNRSQEWAGSGDMQADAVTVNPLFGSDGIAPFLQRASACGGGVFLLVKTSNPSSAEIQDVDAGGRPLYEHLARLVDRWGAAHAGARGYSLLGAVVGGTYPDVLARLRPLMPRALFLVPGFGAQGAGVRDVLEAFDRHGTGAVVSSSRGIIYAYSRPPYREAFGAEGWREAAGEAAEEMRRALWKATHPAD